MSDFESFMFILPALFLGLIPAFIARSKGRDFITWYIYGVALFIIALIHSLLISKDPDFDRKNKLNHGYKECPFCKELMRNDAVICPHCRREVPLENAEQAK